LELELVAMVINAADSCILITVLVITMQCVVLIYLSLANTIIIAYNFLYCLIECIISIFQQH